VCQYAQNWNGISMLLILCLVVQLLPSMYGMLCQQQLDSDGDDGDEDDDDDHGDGGGDGGGSGDIRMCCVLQGGGNQLRRTER